ncbi:MAG: hypothetical protein KTR31_25250 [Myxococcales bacterium]|nr:hypothetical protein [Myxococcales bacterium]
MSRFRAWVVVVCGLLALGVPAPRAAPPVPVDLQSVGTRLTDAPFRAHGRVVASQFAPDGSWLLTVDDAGRLDRWALPDGARLAQPAQPCDEPHLANVVIAPDSSEVWLQCRWDGPWRQMRVARWGQTQRIAKARVPEEPDRDAVGSGPWGRLRSEFVDTRGTLRLVGLPTQGAPWSTEVELLAKVAVHPVRPEVAVLKRDELVILDAHTGEVRQRRATPQRSEAVLPTASGWWLRTSFFRAEVLDEALATQATVPLSGFELLASPDGRWIASSSTPRVEVWHADGRPAAPLAGAVNATALTAMSADGSRVVAATGGQLLWFDVAAPDQPRSIRFGETPWAMDVSPDGRWVAMAASGPRRSQSESGRSLWLVDLEQREVHAVDDLLASETAAAVTFVDGGRRVVVATRGDDWAGGLAVVDRDTRRVVREISTGASYAAIDTDPHTSQALIGRLSGATRVVDVDGRPVPSPARRPFQGDDYVGTATLAGDTLWVQEGAGVRGFDRKGTEVAHHRDLCTMLAVAPTGDRVAISCPERPYQQASTVVVLSLPDRQPLVTVPLPEDRYPHQMRWTDDALLIGGDSWVLEVRGADLDDRQLHWVDGDPRLLPTGWFAVRHQMRDADESWWLTGPRGAWSRWESSPAAALSLDGERFAVGTDDGVQIVEAATGRLLREARLGLDVWRILAVQGGWWLVVDDERVVCLSEDLALTCELTDPPHRLTASADGRWVVGSEHTRVHLYEADGTELSDHQGLQQRAVAAALDGALAAVVDDEARLWVQHEGTERLLSAPADTRLLAASAPLQLLWMGTAHGEVHWLHAPTGASGRVTGAPEARIATLAPLPGGGFVGIQGTGPWELLVSRDGHSIDLRGALGWIDPESLSVSADGSSAVMSRVDGTLQVLPLQALPSAGGCRRGGSN